jgi:ABC-type cobalamin/Fe3+-siderophores transport system ATPase subunit
MMYGRMIFTAPYSAAVRHSSVTLIAGDTGCGKSTQVPQYLLRQGGHENPQSNHVESTNRDHSSV